MKRQRVRDKLLLRFVLVALFTAVLGGFSAYGLSRMEARNEHIYENSVKSAKAVELSSLLQEQRVEFRDQAMFPERRSAAALRLTELDEAFDDTLRWLEDNAYMERGAELLASIRGAYDGAYRQELLSPGDAVGDEAAYRLRLEQLEGEAAVLDGLIEEFQLFAVGMSADTAARSSSYADTLLVIALALSLGAIVAAVLFGLSTAGKIAQPISEIADSADRLALGDLSVELGASHRDEFGTLVRSFNEMVKSIRTQTEAMERVADGDYTVELPVRSPVDAMNIACNRMIANGNGLLGQIRDAAIQVAFGADQIAQSAQHLSSGAAEEAASIEDFSASLGEITKMSRSNAEEARRALETNDRAQSLLRDSIDSMQEMLDAMQKIDRGAQNITKVIKVIDDIAFQTNILALNAAVEAARAGPHGKGFAVVADEVRTLATKSAEAARETASLIESSNRTVGAGNHIVEKTGESLQQVAVSAAELTEVLGHVFRASGEQAQSADNIQQSIEQISSVVQATSASAEQSAASAQELNSQAIVLQEIVTRFSLRDTAMEAEELLRRPVEEAGKILHLSSGALALVEDKY